MDFIVPSGVKPGQAIQVQTNTGLVRVVIPPNVHPGQVLNLQIPVQQSQPVAVGAVVVNQSISVGTVIAVQPQSNIHGNYGTGSEQSTIETTKNPMSTHTDNRNPTSAMSIEKDATNIEVKTDESKLKSENEEDDKASCPSIQDLAKRFCCKCVLDIMDSVYYKWLQESMENVYFKIISKITSTSLSIYSLYSVYNLPVPGCCGQSNPEQFVMRTFAILGLVVAVPKLGYVLALIVPPLRDGIAAYYHQDMWRPYHIMFLIVQIFVYFCLAIEVLIGIASANASISVILQSPVTLYGFFKQASDLWKYRKKFPGIGVFQLVSNGLVLLATIAMLYYNISAASYILKYQGKSTLYLYTENNGWLGNNDPIAHTIDDDMGFFADSLNCSTQYYFTSTVPAPSGIGGGTINQFCVPHTLKAANQSGCCVWVRA